MGRITSLILDIQYCCLKEAFSNCEPACRSLKCSLITISSVRRCAGGNLLVNVWKCLEDVNAVIFHQLIDNLPCEEMGAKVAISSSTKPDPSCRGN